MTRQDRIDAASEFRTLEVQGLSLRVCNRPAPGDEPPLLICNGLGQAAEILFPLMEQLPGRGIVVFDIPGIGRSEVSPVDLTMSQYADLAAEVMQQLGIDRYDVMGISWGGSLAQQLVHTHPDRCRKLILAIASAGGVGSWWGSPIALSEIFFPLRYTSKRYGNFIGPWMYGGEAVLFPKLFRDYSRHAIRPTSQGYYAQVKAICGWTSLPWLHELDHETLVIAGMWDNLIPIANQMLLANGIRNSHLKVYPAGHLLLYSHKEDVGREISGFLGNT